MYSTGSAPPTPARRAEPPRAGGGKGVRLRLETRAGARVVTLVLGLPGTDADREETARVLKSACGTGGTVKDGVVELQGDHREAAQAVLAGRGIKASR